MTAILEDAQELKIDQWGTLNTSASPQRLPEGHSPNNLNVWMDEKPGSVTTSNGYTLLGTLPSGNPPTFGVEFFNNSDGSSKFVVSDGQTVWWTIDFLTFTSIITGLSEFFQLRGMVIRNKLWLTNGTDSVRTFDGNSVVVLDGTGGTPNVPKGKYISYHDERVWMYGIDGDLTALRFSALADSGGTEISPDNASAWPSDNEIQISEGDADIGTGMWLFRGYLYCAKQFSIWRVVGSDEDDYTRVKTRASTGTRFQESVQIKDNLVHFIGVDGGYVFDGEEAKRITDIIDPSNPDEGVFSFRNLQQPLLNNQFWNVSETADFASGTVPANLSTDNDELTLIPADTTQADFEAGTLTNVTATDNPGNLQLSRVDSATPQIITTGLTGLLPTSGAVAIVASAAQLVDQSNTIQCGYLLSAVGLGIVANTAIFEVDLDANKIVNKIVLKNLRLSGGGSSYLSGVITVQIDTGNGVWTTVTTGGPGSISGPYGPTDQSFTFTAQSISKVRAAVLFGGTGATGSNPVTLKVTEMEVYQTGFSATGTFVSKTLDFIVTPASYGSFISTINLDAQSAQFYTQSSDDGVAWDTSANVNNGDRITSALRRYLRWGVTLNSSTGAKTPILADAYVGSTYISEIHNTGGDILQWAAFQMSRTNPNQTINAFYRAASTNGAVLAEGWTAIVPGAIPAADVTDIYIQIKIEISTFDPTVIPSVQSFTVNWIFGDAGGINTLQNVASIVWLNRYWLTAATLGAESNDIVLVLGKSTFNSPWHKKDFSILMFCRYQNILIGGSSVDGSLFQMETGFSKNGDAMDSFYETRDLSKDAFFLKGRELLVTADRSGPYDLSVGWSIDGGITYTEKDMDLTREDDASLSTTKRFNINFMSDNVRFRVRTNAADQPFSVDELMCYYKLSPQRGSIS